MVKKILFYWYNANCKAIADVFLLFLILQVLGPSHPKTGRARDTLNEATYVRIREQRERQAAGTA